MKTAFFFLALIVMASVAGASPAVVEATPLVEATFLTTIGTYLTWNVVYFMC